MDRTYRLEFNEEQQNFHLNNYSIEPNTYGWVTITEHCTDTEFEVLEAYLNRNKPRKLTTELVLKSLDEVKAFWANLMEYNLQITRA